MHPLIERLEQEGLFTHRLAHEAIMRTWQEAKLRDLATELRDLLLHQTNWQTNFPLKFDLFSMIASSSFRGDSGCSHWECRVRKAGILARYASLYCDKLILPVRFHANCQPTDEQGFRYAFCGTILALLQLRHAIDAEVIIPVTDELHFCHEHWKVQVPAYDLIRQTSAALYRENVSQFTVEYHRPTAARKHGTLFMKGPEEYLEHGGMGRILESTPTYISKTATDVNVIPLDKSQIESTGLVQDLFNRIAYDITIQQFYNYTFRSCYLTDLAGEVRLLEKLDEDYVPPSVAKLCQQLTHQIPLLETVPIPTIIRLRYEEPDAFVKYRNSVNDIAEQFIRGCKELGESEVRDIVNDKFRRPVQELFADAEAKENRLAKKSVQRAVISTALVSLGVFGGIFPAHVRELIQALGAFSLVKDAAKAFTTPSEVDEELRKNNFYFLLRLREEHPS